MGSISIREWIRWIPDEASEPTTTIVLTSPQKRFVDLRILHGEASENGSLLPLSRLDWGIAGSTHSSIRQDESGSNISHSKFQHWVSSRTTDPENEVDEGDMYPQPDGSTLEKGSMVNPATGLVTPYEELWKDPEPVATSDEQGPRCFVLEWEDGSGGRGRIVRLGQYCQAFLRAGDDGMAAEKWEWTRESGWKQTAKIGHGDMPCDATVKDDASFEEGDVVECFGRSWTVEVLK